MEKYQEALDQPDASFPVANARRVEKEREDEE
jgi:hypothetical protein